MQIQNKRRDIFSHQSYPKDELIRFIVKDGKIIFPSFSYAGRGYYIKKDKVAEALKGKTFERILKRPLSDEEKKGILGYGQ